MGYELVIAARTLLASLNIKLPPAIGLLVRPIAKCMWRFIHIRRKVEVHANGKILTWGNELHARDLTHRSIDSVDTPRKREVELDVESKEANAEDEDEEFEFNV